MLQTQYIYLKVVNPKCIKQIQTLGKILDVKKIFYNSFVIMI